MLDLEHHKIEGLGLAVVDEAGGLGGACSVSASISSGSGAGPGSSSGHMTRGSVGGASGGRLRWASASSSSGGRASLTQHSEMCAVDPLISHTPFLPTLVPPPFPEPAASNSWTTGSVPHCTANPQSPGPTPQDCLHTLSHLLADIPAGEKGNRAISGRAEMAAVPGMEEADALLEPLGFSLDPLGFSLDPQCQGDAPLLPADGTCLAASRNLGVQQNPHLRRSLMMMPSSNPDHHNHHNHLPYGVTYGDPLLSSAHHHLRKDGTEVTAIPPAYSVHPPHPRDSSSVLRCSLFGLPPHMAAPPADELPSNETAELTRRLVQGHCLLQSYYEGSDPSVQHRMAQAAASRSIMHSRLPGSGEV